jgi:hypothetical protein
MAATAHAAIRRLAGKEELEVLQIHISTGLIQI